MILNRVVAQRARVDPPLCRRAPEWSIDGVDVMYGYRGNITFVALMDLQCDFCHRQLNGIKSLKSTLEASGMRDCNYVVIAPRNETEEWVSYWRRAFRNDGIKILQETRREPVWSTLNGQHHDFFVYDRCGRLIYFIPHPQSNLYFHYTVSSLFAAHHYQHVGCGKCEYDMHRSRNPYTSTRLDHPRHPESRRYGTKNEYLPTPNPFLPHHLGYVAVANRQPHRKTANNGYERSENGYIGGSTLPDTNGYNQGRNTGNNGYESSDNGYNRGSTQTGANGHNHGRVGENEPRPRPSIQWPEEPTTEEDENVGETTTWGTIGTTDEPNRPFVIEKHKQSEDVLQETGTQEESQTNTDNEIAKERTTQINEPVIAPVISKYTDTESVPNSQSPEKVNEEGEDSEFGYPGYDNNEKYEVKEEELIEGEDFEEDETETGDESDKWKTETQWSQQNGDTEDSTEEKKESISETATETEEDNENDDVFAPNPTSESAGQIPAPMAEGLKQPSPTNPSNPNKGPIPSRKPKFIGGASCAEYTDDVCMEQQDDIGTANRHMCCYKGIYLTGKCQPKYCTDQTYNVCCFQKFIQARYLCCHNETIKGDKLDEFSHCCYDNFVFLDNDDPCCPASIAKDYWNDKTSLYELCLPNVDIDFSDMTLETTLRDETKLKLNLGGIDVLHYKCPYAQLRDSFYYWQPEKNNKNATTTEGTDEV